MIDVAITVSGELMVAHVESQTGPGTDFVDAWYPTRPGAEYTVVDSGRLVIHQQDVKLLTSDALRQGLVVAFEGEKC